MMAFAMPSHSKPAPLDCNVTPNSSFPRYSDRYTGWEISSSYHSTDRSGRDVCQSSTSSRYPARRFHIRCRIQDSHSNRPVSEQLRRAAPQQTLRQLRQRRLPPASRTILGALAGPRAGPRLQFPARRIPSFLTHSRPQYAVRPDWNEPQGTISHRRDVGTSSP
jgi:hypothetical protein